MTGVLVPFIVFASITAWVLGPRWLKMWHEQRLKELDAHKDGAGVRAKMLEGERHELEERIRNLESIVCGVDMELNAKLNRLASRQLLLAASPKAQTASIVGETAHPDPMLAATMQLGRLEPGSKVGDRFVIEKMIGAGGMGAVYLARDEKLGEPVALKIMRDMQLAESQVLERFRREVTAARRISNPHVVRLHDLGEEAGMLFLSMEYVAGDSMREVIRRNGVMPVDRVRTITQQICEGLTAAHEAGVVHRDLKPENILLAAGPSGPSVKIIDFGIAKLADLEGMTATRIILGTPQYMAPEQIRGRPVDARTDLYALGIVLYEALSGKPPFDGNSAISVGFAHCSEPLPPLRSKRADVPESWERFVERALAKDPAHRFASAAEMRGAVPAA